MFDIKTETFLQEYFIHTSILGKYCNRKKQCDYLAELFFVTKKECNRLFALAEDEAVRDVVTREDCKRFNRIMQYAEMCQDSLLDSTTQAVIAVKSIAIAQASDNKLVCDESATSALVYKTLLEGASAGNVIAMRVLGILQCEGMFVAANVNNGLKLLSHAAQWGDRVSCLAAVKYASNCSERALAMERLYTVCRDTQFEILYNMATSVYGVDSCRVNNELLLLNKAFATQRAKADVYDPMIARLIYSATLSLNDREKILFSEHKGLLTEVCDLPLKLNYSLIQFNTDALAKIAVKRNNETAKLTIELHNVDLRRQSSYRPICLTTESDYLAESYVRVLTEALAETDVHCQRIDVSDLRQCDFEPTASHVFVRSCCDGASNVFLLVLRGEVDSATIQQVTNFLKTSNRSQFRLNSPRVTLNLSSVLPICICDKANARKIDDWVETVNVADVKADEKRDVILDMVNGKSQIFLTASVTVDEQVLETLSKCSIETADNVLDKIFSEHRFESGFTCVTPDMLTPYAKLLKDGSGRPYGFGGYSK